MNSENARAASEAEVQKQRASIRRSLLRTNSAVVIILAAVLVLAVGAALAGLRATRDQARAEAAERDSQEQLWRSQLDQAGATRLHGHQGRRFEGWEALRKAAAGYAALHGSEPAAATSADRRRLRDEATALLALSDIRESKVPVPVPKGLPLAAVDPALGVFAAADPVGTISVRRMSDGTEVQRLEMGDKIPPTQTRFLVGQAWRPGGNHFAAWFRDGSVAMWTLPTGRLCYYYNRQGIGLLAVGEMKAGFSADGEFFGCYERGRGQLAILEMSQGHEITHPLKTGAAVFSFRPHTREIAVAMPGEIQVLDFSSGAKTQGWRVDDSIDQLAWSNDGRRLAAMANNGDVLLLELNTPQAFGLSGHTGPAHALSFSPDGRTLMSSSKDGTTRWWDTELRSLIQMTGEGRGLTYNAEGTEVIFERSGLSLGRWEVSPSPILKTLHNEGGLTSIYDLSADGKWLAAASKTGLLLWNLETGSATGLACPMTPVGSVVFRPDGGLLLSTGGKIELRDIETRPVLNTDPATAAGTPAFALGPARVLPLLPGLIPKAATLSADGRTAAVEFTTGQVALVDIRGERPAVLIKGQQTMAFYTTPGSGTGGGRFTLSPDAHWIAFAYGMHNGASVFDATSGAFVHDFTIQGQAAFSGNNQRLVVGTDNEYQFFRTRDWAADRSVPCPGLLRSYACSAFTADGRLVALGVTPQVIRLFESADLSPLVTLTSPVVHSLRACRLASDGNRLAAATANNRFQVWDLQSAQRELAPLGLDWPDRAAPGLAATERGFLPTPAPVFTRWLIALGVATVVLAGAATLFLLRRHRGLVHDYATSEALVQQRSHELERAQFGLLHSQKMKALGTLAAGMAHDFNNLLSIIRMSNKLIGREAGGNEEIREHVDSIETAVLQGKQVVGSMLGYSRTQQDDGHPRQVAEIVGDAVALLSTEFLSGIALRLELDRDTPAVAAASGRLEQILLNLVVNAAEAMNGEGTLTIAVHPARARAAASPILAPHPAAGYVELSVTDSGPGVPREIAGRIFEPFFTTKNAGNERGTGLGLSMVYTIAEQDGLGLALESTPGQGATFRILLPIATPPDAAPLPSPVRQKHTESAVHAE